MNNQSDLTTHSNSSDASNDFRIVVVETISNKEFQLCSTCTHRVNELQHEHAAFALKYEAENSPKKQKGRSKKKPNKRRFGHDQMIMNNGNTKYPIYGKKLVFPENEYDILEKKLLEIESEINGGCGDNYKQLSKSAFLCEQRWVTLYCRDYNKPLDEYREEALSVLRHNINFRRGESVRPQSKPVVRQSKRDHTVINPSVLIADGQFGSPVNMSRQQSKTNFGQCISISTLAMGPLNMYTNVENDPCYAIENMLFDVESRLKRLKEEDPDSEAFFELVEKGRRLREEWARTNQQMQNKKPLKDHPDYDITKCVILGKNRRSQISDEFVEVE